MNQLWEVRVFIFEFLFLFFYNSSDSKRQGNACRFYIATQSNTRYDPIKTKYTNYNVVLTTIVVQCGINYTIVVQCSIKVQCWTIAINPFLDQFRDSVFVIRHSL